MQTPDPKTASLTVSLTTLIFDILVNAHKENDVAIVDVEGAYLKADIDNFVDIKLASKSNDILLKMDPQYNIFVTTKNGQHVLCARPNKTFQRCVTLALLWYNSFYHTLDRRFCMPPI
jgi:hypothetical protein